MTKFFFDFQRYCTMIAIEIIWYHFSILISVKQFGWRGWFLYRTCYIMNNVCMWGGGALENVSCNVGKVQR
ncbi:hypothetical protein T01_5885 [Trichinella spiralis]|uniref:Uncharacterized protein n=1 Tax=Trichinella spiralis TaxID=6334 RepID=A0A0V1BWV9_TRISP|nr:hypothetical protein T01_5885 [Trichinella spiralis]